MYVAVHRIVRNVFTYEDVGNGGASVVGAGSVGRFDVETKHSARVVGETGDGTDVTAQRVHCEVSGLASQDLVPDLCV